MGVRWGKRWLGVACWRHAYSVNPQLRSDSDGWGYNPPQGIAYLWHAFFCVGLCPRPELTLLCRGLAIYEPTSGLFSCALGALHGVMCVGVMVCAVVGVGRVKKGEKELTLFFDIKIYS